MGVHYDRSKVDEYSPNAWAQRICTPVNVAGPVYMRTKE